MGKKRSKCQCGYGNIKKEFKHCPICGEAVNRKPDTMTLRRNENGRIVGMRIEEDDGKNEIIHIQVGSGIGCGIKSFSDLMF